MSGHLLVPLGLVAMFTHLGELCAKLIVFRVGRAMYKLIVEGQTHLIHFNDPSTVVMASLCNAALSFSAPVLGGFLEAGGLDAIIQMLNQSTCPRALGYTLDLIAQLVDGDDLPGGSNRGQQLVADKLLELGEYITDTETHLPPACVHARTPSPTPATPPPLTQTQSSPVFTDATWPLTVVTAATTTRLQRSLPCSLSFNSDALIH